MGSGVAVGWAVGGGASVAVGSGVAVGGGAAVGVSVRGGACAVRLASTSAATWVAWASSSGWGTTQAAKAAHVARMTRQAIALVFTWLSPLRMVGCDAGSIR